MIPKPEDSSTIEDLLLLRKTTTGPMRRSSPALDQPMDDPMGTWEYPDND